MRLKVPEGQAGEGGALGGGRVVGPAVQVGQVGRPAAPVQVFEPGKRRLEERLVRVMFEQVFEGGNRAVGLVFLDKGTRQPPVVIHEQAFAQVAGARGHARTEQRGAEDLPGGGGLALRQAQSSDEIRVFLCEQTTGIGGRFFLEQGVGVFFQVPAVEGEFGVAQPGLTTEERMVAQGPEGFLGLGRTIEREKGFSLTEARLGGERGVPGGRRGHASVGGERFRPATQRGEGLRTPEGDERVVGRRGQGGRGVLGVEEGQSAGGVRLGEQRAHESEDRWSARDRGEAGVLQEGAQFESGGLRQPFVQGANTRVVEGRHGWVRCEPINRND